MTVLRDRRFIGALILLLVVVGAWDLHHFRHRHAPAAPPSAAARPISAPALPWRPAASRGAERLSAGARNPFLTAGEQYRGKSGARPTETKGGEGALRLEGIALHGDVRAALIGGEPVREGQFVGDIQVVRVEETQVTFARAGRRWRVALPPPGGMAPTGGDGP